MMNGDGADKFLFRKEVMLDDEASDKRKYTLVNIKKTAKILVWITIMVAIFLGLFVLVYLYIHPGLLRL